LLQVKRSYREFFIRTNPAQLGLLLAEGFYCIGSSMPPLTARLAVPPFN